MSTKNEGVERILAAKPGEVGGKMVGYAEAERQQNPEPPPATEFSGVDECVAAAEKHAGKSIGDMTEQEFYRLPVKLIARNTQGMTELNVVFKDPAMTGHWFNAKAKEGMRVQQGYMQGFTACTKDDVVICHSKATDENGAIVQGDLVLLKIPKMVLWSRYKENQETAKARVNRAMHDPNSASRPGDDSLPRSGEFFITNQTQAQRVDSDEARRVVYA